MNRRHVQLKKKVTKCDDAMALIYDVAKKEGRALTAEEQTEVDNWVEVRNGCVRDVERYEKLLEAERKEPPVYSSDGPSDWPGMGGTRPRTRRPEGPVDPTSGSAWAQRMFGQQGYSVSGFDSVDEFLAVVKSERYDERLSGVMVSGQQEGGGSTGGFVVPEEFAVTSILGPAYEQSVCLQRCETVPMKAEEKTVAGWDTSSASGGTLFGGFTPTIVGEGDSMTPQTGKVRKVKLKARKIGLLGKSSNEIEEDAFALPELMTVGLSTSVAHTLDYYCLWGDGAREPLGAMNSPSKIEVSKENGQQATSVVYQNLTKMLARLHPSLYNDAIWMASPTLVPWLFEMTVNVGTAGSFIPVLTNRDGRSEILLRPVIWSEKCKALGTVGDICLIAWSQYYIGLRKELSIEKSRHIYFESDETAWRAILRADGQPKWAEVYTPRNGDTLSWCVTLETRS